MLEPFGGGVHGAIVVRFACVSGLVYYFRYMSRTTRHASIDRRTPVLSGFAAVMALCALGSGCGGPEAIDLVPGELMQGDISERERDLYRVRLERNRFVVASLRSHRGRVKVTVSTPSGESRAERLFGESHVPLVWSSDEAGSYLVSVSAAGTSRQASYSLVVDQVRPLTRGDAKQLEGQEALAEGDRLLGEWRRDSLESAAASYESAASSFKTAGEILWGVSALRQAAGVYRILGGLDDAERVLSEGLALSREGGAPLGECRVLNDLALVALDAEKPILGRERSESAADLCSRIHARAETIRAQNNLGESDYIRGDPQEAFKRHQEAFGRWEQMNDRRGLARTAMYLGDIHSDAGRPAEALRSYQEALRLWRDLGDRWEEEIAKVALARLDSRQGNWQASMDGFENARVLIDEIGNPLWQADIRNGLGSVYEGIADHERALEQYQQAERLFELAGRDIVVGYNLYDVGRAYFTLGENRLAERTFRSGLKIARSFGDHRLEAYLEREIGRIRQLAGDRRAALSSYSAALASQAADKDFRGQAVTLCLLADLEFDQLNFPKADRLYRRALEISTKAGDASTKALALHSLAKTARRRHRNAEALIHIRQGVEVVERLRANIGSFDSRSSILGAAQPVYRLYLDLLMQSNPLDLAKAFEASEQLRARSLLDMLSLSGTRINHRLDPSLLRREAKLRDQLDLAELELSKSLDPRDRGTAANLEIRESIESLTRDYQTVQSQIQASNPSFAALSLPQPPVLAAVQESLDSETLLLEYLLDSERGYLFLVGHSSIEGFELPGRAKVEGVARVFYALLQEPGRVVPGESPNDRRRRLDRAAAERDKAGVALTRMLLSPVTGKLGTKRLLIVADGALLYLPWAALPDPASSTPNRSSPLLGKHEIDELPSAGSLLLQRRLVRGRPPTGKKIAILADPVFSSGDPRVANEPVAAENRVSPSASVELLRAADGLGALVRLEQTRREALSIARLAPDARLFLGFEASRENALGGELEQYGIIHFATHGLIDSHRPALSGIVLSLVDESGRPQNGFLRLNDIYNLPLSARLVVLSGCQTALGKEVRGEGLVGLTRGFMYAGAETVVASLWKVEDRATAHLFGQFYASLLRDGQSPAQALRRAQTEMLAGSNPTWRDPFYWAGFVVQGEWR